MKAPSRAKYNIATVSFPFEATTLTPSLRSVSFLYEATSAAAPPNRPTFCLYAATQDNAFLVTKTCARLGKRLDSYRFWVMLLHLKGVRFSASSR
jgi:hypothetical protein